jgi:hypothetical protein
MKNPSLKKRILEELEKSGNVYFACAKHGIGRATFYRWKNSNKDFKKKTDHALNFGRMNNCDIAQHSLMKLVREGNLASIKYLLAHNSPLYKPKTRRVILEHIGNKQLLPIVKQKTLEDLIHDEEERRMNEFKRGVNSNTEHEESDSDTF